MHFRRDQWDSMLEQKFGRRTPGRPDQLVTATSLVQNFEIGCSREEYNKRFRYSYSVDGLVLGALGRLVINSAWQPGSAGHGDEDGFEGAPAVAGVIGDTWVDIADVAVRDANYYQGGDLVMFSATSFQNRKIISSNVGTGVFVRCHLDHPLTEEFGLGIGLTAYVSQYSMVETAGSTSVSYETFVGMPLVVVPPLSYFWLQTAGPCWVTATGGTWPGANVNMRDVSINPADGTINPYGVQSPAAGFQRAGYMLALTYNTYGDAFIMLQLDN